VTLLKSLLTSEYDLTTDLRFRSSYASPVLSVEIRASYEADRMLGSGEIIGKLQMSWDELLNHGDGPFGESFVRHSHTCTYIS
jgi:hypothetical protein